MNLTDAYLLGSYTEFLVLMPYLAKVHEEKGLILMRERALGEVKRILNSNKILPDVVDEITNFITKQEKDSKLANELKQQETQELGNASSKWRSEISRTLESVEMKSR